MNLSDGTFKAKLWVALSALALCIAAVAFAFLLYYRNELIPDLAWRKLARAACWTCFLTSLVSLVCAERNLRRLKNADGCLRLLKTFPPPEFAFIGRT